MIPVGVCLATVGTSYVALREAARVLDDLAYDSIWVWDHYLSGRDPHEPVLECWTTLAGLAEATRQVRLGPLVANTINHHPARLAKIAATLQELSGGRLELGIGAGGWAAEQAMVGITQGSRAERNARLAEALQIIPALWSGYAVTYQGHYYQLAGAIVAPTPVPQPRIIVGGRSGELAALAGRYADGFNLHWQGLAVLPTSRRGARPRAGRARARPQRLRPVDPRRVAGFYGRSTCGAVGVAGAWLHPRDPCSPRAVSAGAVSSSWRDGCISRWIKFLIRRAILALRRRHDAGHWWQCETS